MDIPGNLLHSIQSGEAVLFLGSGALYGAKLENHEVPLGTDLRDLLCDEFLGGSQKDQSLLFVSELSISETSLQTVQGFITEIFKNIKPDEYHKLLPQFIWKSIFTTNYDRLIEVIYESVESRLQELNRFISNEDNLPEFQESNKALPLVKLHGCVTRNNIESLPFILTVENYNDSLKGGRQALFNYLYEVALTNPIIFIGHSLQDSNIRAILDDIRREAPNGPRHYFIKPGLERAEKDLWGNKKITAIAGTFEDFLNSCAKHIDTHQRQLALVVPNREHSIEKRFVTHEQASDDLISFLSSGVEYLSTDTPYENYTPDLFYKGANFGWYAQAEELAVERFLTTKIESNIIEKSEEERTTNTELIVIKGEAGSGKTTILKQISWKHKSSNVGVFLWIKSCSPKYISAIEEICRKTKERVYLIWDNASTNIIHIKQVFNIINEHNLPVTIITAERNNEWNDKCEDLDEIVSEVYDVNYLNRDEIIQLINKLEEHNCLGTILQNKNMEERIEAFRERYGRQLLVSLYEATRGLRFEEIITNEYENISNPNAKEIYKTVSTLNRLRVPVRAGLISRIHDINFKDFQDKFFKPLEKIIITTNTNFDIHYQTRHPEIAEIVFKHTHQESSDRYNEYLRILQKINIAFESDNSSFRFLLRAKSLMEVFSDHKDIIALYNTAIENVGKNAYLLQQMAIYERLRANGNLINATNYLEEAKNLAPNDSSVPHTLAVTWEARAVKEEDWSTKVKYRNEAKSIIQKLNSRWGENKYTASSLVKISLDNLVDLLKEKDSTHHLIDSAIKETEKQLIEAKRKYSNDASILSIEADFAKLLEDDKRAIAALQSSFDANDTDPFIASRLASLLVSKGQKNEAIEILEKALKRRPNEHRLNYRYAQLLKEKGEEPSVLSFYFQRAYTPNDKNYDAQFWHARYLYETDPANALKIFNSLRTARVPFHKRIEIRDSINKDNNTKLFNGEICSKKINYGFIKVDGTGEELFVSSDQMKDNLWEAIKVGDRVSFYIGFTFKGLQCWNVLPA